MLTRQHIKGSRTKQLVFIALLVSMGIALQIIESTIPIPVNIPGGKLGLANIATLVTLCVFGRKAAFSVALLRAVVGSLLYGGVSAMIYSVAGALCAALAMALCIPLTAKYISLIGVSIIGAVCHNAAQVTIAAIILGNVWIYGYLPVLAIISTVTGIFTGIAANLISKYQLKTES